MLDLIQIKWFSKFTRTFDRTPNFMSFINSHNFNVFDTFWNLFPSSQLLSASKKAFKALLLGNQSSEQFVNSTDSQN